MGTRRAAEQILSARSGAASDVNIIVVMGFQINRFTSIHNIKKQGTLVMIKKYLVSRIKYMRLKNLLT